MVTGGDTAQGVKAREGDSKQWGRDQKDGESGLGEEGTAAAWALLEDGRVKDGGFQGGNISRGCNQAEDM